jgi:hypothetical protein
MQHNINLTSSYDFSSYVKVSTPQPSLRTPVDKLLLTSIIIRDTNRIHLMGKTRSILILRQTRHSQRVEFWLGAESTCRTESVAFVTQQNRYDRICRLYVRLSCSAGRPVVTTVLLLFLFLILSNKKNMKEGEGGGGCSCVQ